jgi:hypothetical protein
MFLLGVDPCSPQFDGAVLENELVLAELSAPRFEGLELTRISELLSIAHLPLDFMEVLAMGTIEANRDSGSPSAVLSSLSRRFQMRLEKVSIFEAMTEAAISTGKLHPSTVEVATLEPDPAGGYYARVVRQRRAPELRRIAADALPAWLNEVRGLPLVFRSGASKPALPSDAVDLTPTHLSQWIAKIAWTRIGQPQPSSARGEGELWA